MHRLSRLRVCSKGRRLLREDGSAFFYLADTAWELFHLLTPEEIRYYLELRASQQFTVIQAVLLAEFDGVATPNARGELPFVGLDPTKPNEAYFQQVDEALRMGVEKGLLWGLLPTWGDKWNQKWGKGPEVFTPENAGIFGRWLGNRYREIPLIWILGGDRPIENERHMEIIRSMAAGLKEGDGGSHLMTFHPPGGATSTQWVHDEPWLDFNMLQSGHESGRLDNHRMVAADYQRKPAKPCLDAEPVYENHPEIAFDRNRPAPYFGELATRRAAYQALFAGACGHTYGCHDIWQFYDGVRAPHNRARTPWKEAMHLPGALQMKHLRDLMESLPFADLSPTSTLASVLPSGQPVQAMLSEDKKTALIYFPTQGTRSVQLSALNCPPFRATWFDPRTGKRTDAGSMESCDFMEWTSPEQGEDWILILQSSS